MSSSKRIVGQRRERKREKGGRGEQPCIHAHLYAGLDAIRRLEWKMS